MQNIRRGLSETGSFVAWTVFAASLAAGGCITPHHSYATDVDAEAWSTPAEIVLPNTDTLALRDIGLFLRCNDRFAEDTLTVRIQVLAPDSLRFDEPFTLFVPRARTPAARMRLANIPYRRRVLLGRTGDYRLRVTPMRTVRGIEAVGVEITDSAPNQH